MDLLKLHFAFMRQPYLAPRTLIAAPMQFYTITHTGKPPLAVLHLGSQLHLRHHGLLLLGRWLRPVLQQGHPDNRHERQHRCPKESIPVKV